MMASVSHTSSFYAASALDKTQRPQLTQDLNCDVCIIGAGYTGLSSAIHLAEKGFNVVILEGSRIGFGASGRNGGQIVHSYSRDMDFIEHHFGKDTGDAMGSMAFEGAKVLRRFVKDYNIECDLKPGGIFAACTQKQLDEMATKKALWESYGHQELDLLTANQVKEHIGSERYVGALFDKSGGHFHPLNLALRL